MVDLSSLNAELPQLNLGPLATINHIQFVIQTHNLGGRESCSGWKR